jgi:hypothetical protein
MKTLSRRKLIPVLKPQRESPGEIAERNGYGPQITVLRGHLRLQWRKDQVAEALDSAGMTAEQLVAIHLVPRLTANKTVYIKHHGRTIARCEGPDWNMRFKTLKLAMQLHGFLSD